MRTKRLLAVIICLIIMAAFLAVPASAVGSKKSTAVSENIAGMNETAFEVYQIIAHISVPLAIISFASCGWKFLGSIFFGNYASMAGNDMMKAQRQLIFTILGLMFILLLPRLYGSAIALFESGFDNGAGGILKPWTPPSAG